MIKHYLFFIGLLCLVLLVLSSIKYDRDYYDGIREKIGVGSMFPIEVYVKVNKKKGEKTKVILWLSKELYPDYELQILP